MTLEQLRIFVEVAERRHMTRAAEALHLTQSAVSAAVSALEARYGTRLFERVGRGIDLSAAGDAFLPEAKAVLARAEAAVGALDDLAGLRRGKLMIAASQTVSNYWLPGRMAKFAQAHPGVSLSLSVGNTAQVGDLVSAGVAELGFVEGEVSAPHLERRQVAVDRLGLYAATAHPLVGHYPILSDLRAANWVVRESGSGTRSHMERGLLALGLPITQMTVLFEAPSNEACLAAVAAGGLLTVVSDLAARPHVGAGRLSRLNFELPERAFDRLSHSQRRRSRAGEAFLAML
jgi:DNA-binding transcriptional LysR family regulator